MGTNPGAPIARLRWIISPYRGRTTIELCGMPFKVSLIRRSGQIVGHWRCGRCHDGACIAKRPTSSEAFAAVQEAAVRHALTHGKAVGHAR